MIMMRCSRRCYEGAKGKDEIEREKWDKPATSALSDRATMMAVVIMAAVTRVYYKTAYESTYETRRQRPS